MPLLGDLEKSVATGKCCQLFATLTLRTTGSALSFSMFIVAHSLISMPCPESLICAVKVKVYKIDCSGVSSTLQIVTVAIRIYSVCSLKVCIAENTETLPADKSITRLLVMRRIHNYSVT